MIDGFEKRSFSERLKTVFTPAQPISRPEHLHGRDQKLRLIERALNSPGKHVFIFGDRGVGKTSLARTAASLHCGSEQGYAFVVCDQVTQFSDIVHNICRQLRTCSAARGTGATQSGLGIEVRNADPLTAPDIRTINDAIDQIRSLTPRQGPPAIAIVDEFDQLSAVTDKKFVADLIKQLSDQNIDLRLMICGIGSSLDELIGVHLSTDRYLAAIPLPPLSHDARWQIINTGADAFGISIERNSVIRIGQLSDGYPYYVHLMGEQIFWEAFDDPNPTATITMDHYSKGLRAAIEEAQTSLRNAYDLAVQKHNNSKDYEEVLWSVADGPLLQRPTSEIYDKSYLRIKNDQRGSVALPKDKFYQRLNALKKAAHGSIVIGNRQGWYSFRENILRGYVRLRAEREGMQIGIDHIGG